MARRKSLLYCQHCNEYTLFEYLHRRHDSFPGGHEDWHCVTCGGCEYMTFKTLIRIEPPQTWSEVRQ
jgi:hypothetical protein